MSVTGVCEPCDSEVVVPKRMIGTFILVVLLAALFVFKTKKKYEARRMFGKKVRDTAKRKKPKKEVRGTAKVQQRSTRHGEGAHCPQIPSLIVELPKVHGHRSAGLEPKGESFLSKRPKQTADLELTFRIFCIPRIS